ncbi:MAG: helix-turn-helix transcriptional regulator [Slackia piriformis]|uniref:Helix-turn-helix transcriptional regulator n=1 Tax=Slackia piriformis TaxID=626934 RepID=A0A943UZ03_9ACTN|nr:helix-turn-helix transcriptional regulator [Slackia piriformis]
MNLTPREREVCSLWVRGHTAAHIERRLCVSKSTVKTHVSHIYEKAGVSSREELIAAFEEFAPSRSR